MASGQSSFRIPRRPLTSAGDPPPPTYSDLFPEPLPPPPLLPRLRGSKSVAQLPVQPQHNIQPPPPPPLPGADTTTTTTTAAAAAAAAPLRRAKSSVDLGRPRTAAPRWKATLDEARHLAGGLLASPAESTRHHSIIRHSPALLWHRGPSTAALLTVLSARPLPAARTLHLQRRGLSGDLGMALKARAPGGAGSWLDVTPERRGTPADLGPLRERGVQRDLRRFARAAAADHAPRETLALRIPAAARDGYWRVVLCGDDGAVLVGSPVFRLASTAADGVGVLRGAGLRTAPLEVGAMVAAKAARTYVAAASGAARLAAGAAARRGADVVGDAVKAGWAESARDRSRVSSAAAAAMRPTTVGLLPGEDGPAAPFPLRVAGTVVRGTGYARARHGFRTANLADGASAATGPLTGYFAAWAGADDDSGQWCEAVARVGPAENARASVAARSGVAVRVLRELEGDEAALEGRRLRVVLMGFLRGLGGGEGEDGQGHAEDARRTLASLAREGWGMEEEEEEEGGWSLGGLAGMLAAGMDAVPVHRAGIRSEAGAWSDASFGRGGFWIPR